MSLTEKLEKHFLELERRELVSLIRVCDFEIEESDDDDWLLDSIYIQVTGPPLAVEAMQSLSKSDKKRLLEAITRADQSLEGRTFDASSFLFPLRGEEKIHSPRLASLCEIIIQRGLMIDVATRGKPIQDVNDYYRAREKRLSRSLEALQLGNPNPHSDLWDWYRYWKENLPSYSDRRLYVYQLYSDLVEKLSDPVPEPAPPREATGWERVDRTVEKARGDIEIAQEEEDFQSVGLLCREILISLAQAVYDPAIHESLDGQRPGDTDARRMLEAFISCTVPGPHNELLRGHAKASLKLAVGLQHQRTAEFRNAALCLEATSSLVNVIAILSGKRDPAENREI